MTIMKKFCRENPVERLGYQKDGIMDIRKHRWFQVNFSRGLVWYDLVPPELYVIDLTNNITAYLFPGV